MLSIKNTSAACSNSGASMIRSKSVRKRASWALSEYNGLSKTRCSCVCCASSSLTSRRWRHHPHSHQKLTSRGRLCSQSPHAQHSLYEHSCCSQILDGSLEKSKFRSLITNFRSHLGPYDGGSGQTKSCGSW